MKKVGVGDSLDKSLVQKKQSTGLISSFHGNEFMFLSKQVQGTYFENGFGKKKGWVKIKIP